MASIQTLPSSDDECVVAEPIPINVDVPKHDPIDVDVVSIDVDVVPTDATIYKGKTFAWGEEARQCYQDYGGKKGFIIKKRTDYGKGGGGGEPMGIKFTCSCEGSSRFGGNSNAFDARDCWNYVAKLRDQYNSDGDVEHVGKYFQQRLEKDP